MSESLLAVSAKEFAGRLGFYQDEAMHRPVGVQRHGTLRTVLISAREYDRLKRRDRQVIRTEDLDDETLDAILNAEPGERSREAGRRLSDPPGMLGRYRSRVTFYPILSVGTRGERRAGRGTEGPAGGRRATM